MKKMRKNAGFTLVEMLIVVAIIAILIAVSIPLVSGSLEKAREATDQANERAAKAAANIEYLTGDLKYDQTGGTVCRAYYDAESGSLNLPTAADGSGSATTPTQSYGKCHTSAPSGGGHSGGYLQVDITKGSGEVDLTWVQIAAQTATGVTFEADEHGFY